MSEQIKDEGLTCAYLLGKSDGYKQGKSEAFDEVIKTLAKSEDTMLSDAQYYTLMELKGE